MGIGATATVRGYRWGWFQGISLILIALVGLLVGGFENWSVVFLEITFAGTGLCLLWKMRGGVVALFYLSLSLICHMIFDGGHPVPALVALLFFALPAFFYYPKRWNQLSWSGASNRKPKNEQPSKQPSLLPDFGKHLAESGTPQNARFIYPTWEIDALQIISEGRYCATRVQAVNGKEYCATFDFDDDVLIEIMRRASVETLDTVTESIEHDPSSTRSIPLPSPVNVGISAILGELQQGLHDVFIPLVIQEVFGEGHYQPKG